MKHIAVFFAVMLAAAIASAQHPSACRIGTQPHNGVAAGGSGSLIATGNGLGLVLTAAHVVEGERIGAPIYCEFPGRPKVAGSLAAINHQCDSAVILLDARDISGLQAVPWFEGNVSQGQRIWSDGWPASRYSRINGQIIATTDNGFAFRTTAVPWEGHSGGPVFSQDGRLMGLVSARYGDGGGLGGIVYRVGPIRSWLTTIGWRLRRALGGSWQFAQIGFCPGGGCQIMPYGGQQPQPSPEYQPPAPYGGGNGGGNGGLYVEPPFGVDPNQRNGSLPPVDDGPSDSQLRKEIEQLRNELDRLRGDNFKRYVPPLDMNDDRDELDRLRRERDRRELEQEQQPDDSGINSKLDDLKADIKGAIAGEAIKKAAEAAGGGLTFALPSAALTAFGIGGPPALAILAGAWILRHRPVRTIIKRRREAARVPFDQPASQPASVSPGTRYQPAATADHHEEEIVEDYIERRPAVVERPFRRRTIVQRGAERVAERKDNDVEERPVGDRLRRAAEYVGRPSHFNRVRPDHWNRN